MGVEQNLRELLVIFPGDKQEAQKAMSATVL